MIMHKKMEIYLKIVLPHREERHLKYLTVWLQSSSAHTTRGARTIMLNSTIHRRLTDQLPQLPPTSITRAMDPSQSLCVGVKDGVHASTRGIADLVAQSIEKRS